VVTRKRDYSSAERAEALRRLHAPVTDRGILALIAAIEARVARRWATTEASEESS
jgi:hypothetical protein